MAIPIRKFTNECMVTAMLAKFCSPKFESVHVLRTRGVWIHIQEINYGKNNEALTHKNTSEHKRVEQIHLKF